MNQVRVNLLGNDKFTRIPRFQIICCIFALKACGYVSKENAFDIECGIKITMEVIGGKWKNCILLELNKKPMRPSELHREFADASPRVIDQKLRELEMHGMISKKIFAELPPRSEYSITDAGRTLIPLINQIEAWGDGFRPEMKRILGIEDEASQQV